MISCDEAKIICNKTQYKESTFMERLKLKLHLFMCNACAKFTKQNTELTVLCEKAHLQSLSAKEKKKMKGQLEEKI